MLRKVTCAALLSAIIPAGQAAQELPTMEEMWAIIQQQNVKIKRLEAQQQSSTSRIEETEIKIEATAEAVEQGATGGAIQVADWATRTQLGGYGELHYNNLEEQSASGADKDEVDLHRFVIYMGHQFSDSVKLFSEIEIEHSLAGDGAPGEVEIEQAYIDWNYAANHNAKAGLFLLPVGITNETHEPDTFYGVERNKVEAEIIPATWWEGGLGLNGEIAPGLSYDVAVHSGLFLDDTARVRSGRQKVAQAKADNLAVTGRIKYTGIAGLELAATLQRQTDVFQGETFSGESDIAATLVEAHAVWQSGPIGLRALYALWDFDEGINAVAGRSDADRREGFYIEPSYQLTDDLGIFARYSEWDEVRADAGADMAMERIDVGLNYWLTQTVVLKADWQDEDGVAGRSEQDGFNLGVGWSY